MSVKEEERTIFSADMEKNVTDLVDSSEEEGDESNSVSNKFFNEENSGRSIWKFGGSSSDYGSRK